MKYLKKYDNQNIENKNIDLRRVGKFVECIKTYKRVFKKGNYYKQNGFYGDPHGAIEAGIKDYVPIEFIARIMILDSNNKEVTFEVNINKKYRTSGEEPSFFEYFKIPEFTEYLDKYNI